MHMYHRAFDWTAQEHFARVSGDYNPIHVNTTAARRTHSGAPIVHGIHSLIWILDSIAQVERDIDIKSLKVQFLQPIYVGDDVTLEISSTTGNALRARIVVGTEDLVVASLQAAEPKQALSEIHAIDSMRITPPEQPNDLRLEDMERFAGRLSFAPAIQEVRELFPSAVAAFGMERIAALACSSCLVGMVVPGLHSLFSGLEVSFNDDMSVPAGGIEFAVVSVAARFRLVRIRIDGKGLRGSLDTISRLPPAQQPSVRRAIECVSREEFRHSTALIVGGSRGIGELTAKLLAAGGSHVIVTYKSGKNEADALVQEISSAGLVCTNMAYDVHQPAREQLRALDVIPTHVYYFATPTIFRRKNGLFDRKRFEEFNSFYLNGFFDLVQECVLLRSADIRVFYPSSTAIDSRPATMTEYSMSKAAGEVLCADLSKFLPGVRVITHRLPRLPTDQTSSIAQTQTLDPIEVLLPIVRQMQRETGTNRS